ncbi:MAG TPA: LuxR C-terminal-related transcriptional regulator [Gaiellaceae bacterium]|jgi:DNA-binding CsgD family transcriptional regulator|nr:LuxR C-terminal-related transcriptional regulator [Gaiellaceae bacterium]
MAETYRSGDALFAFGADLIVTLWNEEAERLTGIPAAAALGRPCWELLHGVSERGDVLCHPGCSGARLAREGWPVPCRRMLIATPAGRRLVSVSTVSVRREGEPPVVLNLIRSGPENGPARPPAERLTRRQAEILQLLAAGEPAKVIAARLGLSETTVRNHIAAILRCLGCHSQLEAVAEARRRGLVA